MTIRVLFFGSLAHDLGEQTCNLVLSDNARVADALSALREQYPSIDKHADRIATAVNLEYVKQTHVLHDQDELALIPPVSGG